MTLSSILPLLCNPQRLAVRAAARRDPGAGDDTMVQTFAISQHTWLRLLSLGIVGGFIWSFGPSGPLAHLDESAWKAVVLSLAFVHYVLAFVYSRGAVARVLGQRHSHLPLLVLAAACALLYVTEFPLMVVFGVHHVLNEVYLLNRKLGLTGNPRANAFHGAAIALNGLIFAALMSDQWAIGAQTERLLFLALGAAAVVFFTVLYRTRGELRGGSMADACLFEVAGLALVALSLREEIGLLHVVLYHVVFWTFYPLPGLARRGSGASRTYAVLNLGLAALFVGVSPLGFAAYSLMESLFWQQFMLWSYIHILSSLALSAAHPAWVTQWFRPRSAPSHA